MLDRPAVRWTIVAVSVAAAVAALLWGAVQLGWLFAGDGAASVEVPTSEGVVVPLGSRTYGLAASDGGSVRIEAALVIADAGDVEVVLDRQPLLDAAMVVALAGLDRADVTGPDGASLLRSELLAAARDTYPQVTVQQALIIDLVAG